MTRKLVVKEDDWKRTVIGAMKLFGWRFAHFRPARTKYGWTTAMEGDKGWPDLVAVRPPRLIIAELKPTAVGRRPSEVTMPSDEQAAWLTLLGEVPGVETYVWRPEQLDAILMVLGKDAAPARGWAVKPEVSPHPYELPDMSVDLPCAICGRALGDLVHA